jgi:hypothetical protein
MVVREVGWCTENGER